MKTLTAALPLASAREPSASCASASFVPASAQGRVVRLVDQLKTTALPEHTRRFTRTFQPGHPATGGRQVGRYSPDKKYRYISPKMPLCIMTQDLRHYNENCPYRLRRLFPTKPPRTIGRRKIESSDRAADHTGGPPMSGGHNATFFSLQAEIQITPIEFLTIKVADVR